MQDGTLKWGEKSVDGQTKLLHTEVHTTLVPRAPKILSRSMRILRRAQEVVLKTNFRWYCTMGGRPPLVVLLVVVALEENATTT